MSALEELADRYGIQTSYCDARGDTQHTSPETRRALLAAMGIDAADEAALRAGLSHLDRIEWENALAPVCVCPRGTIAVSVNVPRPTTRLAWRLTLEDGGVRSGEADVERLALEAQRQMGGVTRERRRLVLPDIPLGYHSLTVTNTALAPLDSATECGGATRLIVTPGTCWLPAATERGERLWGVSAQLYLLRSGENWGIGDFGDLRRLVEMLGPLGADVIGLNPLHAMFLDAPEQASPYSPASRLLLNVLYIDVAALTGELDCAVARKRIASEPFQRALKQCRNANLVDYSGVAALKVPVLRLLFDWARSDRAASQWQAFEAFRRTRGEMLERGCLYLALREHFAAQTSSQADWHAWPAEYRDPNSSAVLRFGQDQAELVTFHAWLQFVADAQLGAAAAAANTMAVGLYRDLAVGADRSGAETWGNQIAVVSGAQVGAPPDIYNPVGQDWGLPPFNPRALRDEAYQSFIDLVRANMRHAGGLRIDHVMALQQLYWVPDGQTPSHGAFVRYPLEDLVGILALESQRNQCLVVGEDLGTVPAGFRERMAAANILSYRVLFFEKDEKGYLTPDQYPAAALSVAGSHDLPTLRAWWEASDLELREELHLFPTADDARMIWKERKRDREKLLEALQDAGLAGNDAVGVDALNRAVHAYLARSNAAFAMAQLDDITDEGTPVNVPTTSDEHPNWRRRLSLSLEQLSIHPRLARIAEIFRHERTGRQSPAARR